MHWHALTACHLVTWLLQSVAVAMRTDLTRALLWATVYISEDAVKSGMDAVRELVSSAWASGQARSVPRCGGAHAASGGSASDGQDGEEGDDDCVVDDYLLPPTLPRRTFLPQITYVVVPALPRG